MYVSIGPSAVARRDDIIGIFDMDNSTWSHRTRKSLAVCEQEGSVVLVGEDIPRALVICSERKTIRKRRRMQEKKRSGAVVYMTQLSVQTLQKRVESEQI